MAGSSNTGIGGTGGTSGAGGGGAGGLSATGGLSDSGGASAGGITETGGSSATGGVGSGGISGTGGATGGIGGTTGGLVVRLDLTKRTIEGFGINDTWSPLTAEQAQHLFDATNGLGLTILRVGMDESGALYNGLNEANLITLARGYGATKIIGTAWSPPASFKDNSSTTKGGRLYPQRYEAWATTLAKFAKDNGLYAMSPQTDSDFASPVSILIHAGALVRQRQVLQEAREENLRHRSLFHERFLDIMEIMTRLADDDTAAAERCAAHCRDRMSQDRFGFFDAYTVGAQCILDLYMGRAEVAHAYLESHWRRLSSTELIQMSEHDSR